MEVENMLLEPLSDYSMSIPELGTISCELDNKPFFVLTSNNQREISEKLGISQMQVSRKLKKAL